MLRSVMVEAVVRVAITWPISSDLWAGFWLSGVRAASWVAWVLGLGEAVVLLYRPREREGQVVRR